MLVIQHILELNGVQHQAGPEQRLDTLFITHDHKKFPISATDALEGFILTLESLFTKQCDNLHHFNLSYFFICQIQSLFSMLNFRSAAAPLVTASDIFFHEKAAPTNEAALTQSGNYLPNFVLLVMFNLSSKS